MRVLGVDCGSAVTGFGLIESDGRIHRPLSFGAVKSSASQPFPERLHGIHQRLTDLIVGFHPECVAIEDVFYAENVKSALKLGHVRGVVMQAAAAQGVAVAEYTPLTVKSTLTGYGRAEKEQVAHMVRLLLKLRAEDIRSLDTSDALAVAICHVHHAGAAIAVGAGKR